MWNQNPALMLKWNPFVDSDCKVRFEIVLDAILSQLVSSLRKYILFADKHIQSIPPSLPRKFLVIGTKVVVEQRFFT